MTASKTPLNQALGYLAHGFSFYPVRPRSKEPFDELLPLIPRDGRMRPAWSPFQYAPPTEADVRHWFNICPHLNIAFVTGMVSRAIAVDIDDPDTLQQSYPNLTWPHTPMVKSRRGLHIYFAHPGFPVRGSLGLPDVDLKGDGGCITAPPSVHASGYKYHWLVPLSVPLAPVPDWMLEVLRRESERLCAPPAAPSANYMGGVGGEYRAYVEKIIRTEIDALRVAPKRNEQLNKSAYNLGRCVGAGMLDEATARGILESEAYAIGLTPGEIRATIRSGLSDGMARPRPLPSRSLASRPLPSRQVQGTKPFMKTNKQPRERFASAR